MNSTLIEYYDLSDIHYFKIIVCTIYLLPKEDGQVQIR